ncbi:major capsid protein [robinz microvirus RP_33]|nr:major capsid protein [robinz microvirus RP_33]
MKRSKFNLSYTKLLTCDMGELVPIGLTEVLPGDTVQQATSALIRCSPLLAPVMHPVRVQIHHWYVPHRLVWEDFEDFITGGPTGMDASVFPTIAMPAGPGAAIGSLADYLGVPTGVSSLGVSALPFRAYAKIFNEWYRDQDLQTELVIDETSGVDTTTSVALQNADWEKDYFTSARPWEQKGPTITIPLGTTAPIDGIGYAATVSVVSNQLVRETDGTSPTYPFATEVGLANVFAKSTTGTGASTRPEIFANLSGASAITINALREAMALQRYSEARARYGSRYVEYLRYLGVRSSDARLQRPEYLGGGRQVIQFSEVLQTAEGTDPVGEMRGHGIAGMRSNRYRKFFEEHGYVISLLTCRPKTIYVQGLFRHWNRRFKEDFWQQELQHIGQQEIQNKEVYAPHASPDATFGFQDRYDEYRRSESLISGEFRNTTLDHWHMARIFSSSPALNASFVSSVPTKRIFASTATDGLYVTCKHSIQARRMVAAVGKSYIY